LNTGAGLKTGLNTGAGLKTGLNTGVIGVTTGLNTGAGLKTGAIGVTIGLNTGAGLKTGVTTWFMKLLLGHMVHDWVVDPPQPPGHMFRETAFVVTPPEMALQVTERV
jgi:hypothetical protein